MFVLKLELQVAVAVAVVVVVGSVRWWTRGGGGGAILYVCEAATADGKILAQIAGGTEWKGVDKQTRSDGEGERGREGACVYVHGAAAQPPTTTAPSVTVAPTQRRCAVAQMQLAWAVHCD